MILKQFEGQDRKDLSMIEVAHAILEQKGDVVDFTELLIEIQNYLELSELELESRMVRFYTDLNIDGRFISLGENRWGLRGWYPIDAIDEEIISSAEAEDDRPVSRRKKRKYNAFSEGDDMIDYNDDDPEDADDIYDTDLDDYGDVDEEDEDDDDTRGLTLIEDDAVDLDDDENQELGEYASDLSDFGDDDLDLDGDASFEAEDDEADDFESEDEEYEEELQDKEE